jgi:subtilisin family serine protease
MYHFKHLKRFILLGLLFGYPMLANISAVAAENESLQSTALNENGALADYWPGRVIVKFREGTQSNRRRSLRSRSNAGFIKALPSINGEVWRVDDVEATISALQRQRRDYGDIEYMQPDYVIRAGDLNSAGFGAFNQRRSLRENDEEPIVHVETKEPVVCAVLDSGVDYNHPDLKDKILRTEDGKIVGYDFVNDDDDPMDDCGHGTHIAGIIAGVANEYDNRNVTTTNGLWPVKMIPLKILKRSSEPNEYGMFECVGSQSDAIKALEYVQNNAEEYGIKCTNNSWNVSYMDDKLDNAIKAEAYAGRLFVFSAGNSDSESGPKNNDDSSPYYPASPTYTNDPDNIISVCSVHTYNGENSQLSFFSNYGKQSVDLCALGYKVRSTSPNNEYQRYSGTAMAAPFVTNAVTLLWSAFPHLTAAEVKAHIMDSVDKVPALERYSVTGGRLNLRNAITSVQLKELEELEELTPIITLSSSQGVVPLVVTADASHSLGKIISYKWASSDGQVSFGPDVTFEFATPDIYVITLAITDESNVSATTQKSVTVRENQSPIALFSVSPNSGLAPLLVKVDASESLDVDGTISYQWQSSENHTGSEPKITFLFETPEEHTISLTVTDSHGATDTSEQIVTVKAQIPEISISPTARNFLDELLDEPKQKMPNDSNFSELWALHNTGQIGNDIGATKAWGITTGEPVVCAVLDSGVNSDHPDLKDNIVPGWNFIDNNADTSDNCGHGTQIAGIIGAVGNNNEGITGVNWSAKIMPLVVAELKPASEIGEKIKCSASDDAIIAALKYAQEQGVKCVNISLAAASSSNQKLFDTIQAYDGLIIAAAGNERKDNDEIPFYPASYDLDNILSVCATDRTDHLVPFSNVGRKSVDLCAPGSGIKSTHLNGRYVEESGTSMSTAYVSGAVSLLWSAFPTLTALEIKDHLIKSANYLPQLRYKDISFGRLNVYQALRRVQSERQTFTIANTGQSDLEIDQIRLVGDNASAFKMSYDGCSSQQLAPDKSCVVEVLFDSNEPGDKKAVLEVLSNAPQTVSVQLSGFVEDSSDDKFTVGIELPTLERAEPAVYRIETGEVEIPTVAIPKDKGYADIYKVKLCPVNDEPLRFAPCEIALLDRQEKILGDTLFDASTGIIHIPGVEVGSDTGIFYEVMLQMWMTPKGKLEFEVSKLIKVH